MDGLGDKRELLWIGHRTMIEGERSDLGMGGIAKDPRRQKV